MLYTTSLADQKMLISISEKNFEIKVNENSTKHDVLDKI